MPNDRSPRTDRGEAPDLARVRTLVLAGGASTRFFPVNKVFSDPTGAGRTMVQQALDRVVAPLDTGRWREFLRPSQFLVVTGSEAREAMVEQLEVPARNILAEPDRRSTWPAILWALAHVRAQDSRATIIMLTADHVIGDLDVFRESLAEAVALAQREPAIVTFGISPSSHARDWTAFGAVRAGAPHESRGSACVLERFEEKPSEPRAGEMIREEKWCWNSGMFVFGVETAERALEVLQPPMSAVYRRLADAVAYADSARARRTFLDFASKIPHPLRPGEVADNSIDFAVMMPLTATPRNDLKAYVVPARFRWTDIGSWDALRHVVPSGPDGVIRVGDTEGNDTRDSILVAEPGRAVRASGLEGVVVVHATNGWVLVTREDRAPELKSLVGELPRFPGAVAFKGCEDCFVPAGSASTERTALFAVQNVEVVRSANRVEVRPLARGGDAPRRVLLERLASAVLPLSPAVKHYPWGGSVLPRILGREVLSDAPTAEAWLTSTQADAVVGLESAPLTLAELVKERPDVLGDWSRRLFGDELPVFVKFISTRFPPRVHLGLRAEAIREAGGTTELRRALLQHLRTEQELLRRYRSILSGECLENEDVFDREREVYEGWAVDQSRRAWRDAGSDGDFARRLAPFLRADVVPTAVVELVRQLRENRAQAVSVFREVDLRGEEGNAILSEAGTAHAIFGLSHQSHPQDRSGDGLRALLQRLRQLAAEGAGDARLRAEVDAVQPELTRRRQENEAPPKNEAWIPFRIGKQVIIVEPQQTSNTTYSWLDLYTPFVYRNGRVVFRKGDSERGVEATALERYVEALDIASRREEEWRRRPVEVAAGPSRGARLLRLIDDPACWPYFTVYRVDLQGEDSSEARWANTPSPGAFQQLVVVRGEVVLKHSAAPESVVRLHPGRPAFVPATLDGSYEIGATESASVLLVSVPTPYPGVRT